MSLEVIASSVDEAIAQGLEELGLSEDQVEIEVMDIGSEGLFGLGSREARVKLKVKSEDVSAAPAMEPEAGKIEEEEGIDAAENEVLAEEIVPEGQVQSEEEEPGTAPVESEEEQSGESDVQFLPGIPDDVVLHVADMDVDCLINDQFRFTGVCSVLVVDHCENPVAGVYVACDWKKYKMEGSVEGTTDDRGIAVLTTRLINDLYAPFCFTVTDVSVPGAIYDPQLNLVTHACESGWVWKGNEPADDLPDEFSLGQNYPNPFNPSTEITFALPSPTHVRLGVYNIRGQKVTSLVDRYLGAGSHTVTWDGTGLASGIYIYRISTEENTVSRKMLLLK